MMIEAQIHLWALFTGFVQDDFEQALRAFKLMLIVRGDLAGMAPNHDLTIDHCQNCKS